MVTTYMPPLEHTQSVSETEQTFVLPANSGYTRVRTPRREMDSKMAPYRVMIVDDSALVRQVLHDLVSQDPHLEVCSEAEDGKVAIKLCAEENPDLILLDLQMPEWDGLNFLRHYRSQTRAKIIILSAMVSGNRKPIGQNALKMGADAVVSKPENMSDEQSESIQELMRTVYELLGIQSP